MRPYEEESFRSFGNRIRYLREEKELTQQQLGDSCDVDKAYICLIENDRCNPPINDKIEKMAACLGVDSFELYLLAGRLPKELVDLMKETPLTTLAFLREAVSDVRLQQMCVEFVQCVAKRSRP